MNLAGSVGDMPRSSLYDNAWYYYDQDTSHSQTTRLTEQTRQTLRGIEETMIQLGIIDGPRLNRSDGYGDSSRFAPYGGDQSSGPGGLYSPNSSGDFPDYAANDVYASFPEENFLPGKISAGTIQRVMDQRAGGHSPVDAQSVIEASRAYGISILYILVVMDRESSCLSDANAPLIPLNNPFGVKRNGDFRPYDSTHEAVMDFAALIDRNYPKTLMGFIENDFQNHYGQRYMVEEEVVRADGSTISVRNQFLERWEVIGSMLSQSNPII